MQEHMLAGRMVLSVKIAVIVPILCPRFCHCVRFRLIDRGRKYPICVAIVGESSSLSIDAGANETALSNAHSEY